MRPPATVVGFTGHQSLSPASKGLVREAIKRLLAEHAPVIGISSLAAGSDQIFAEIVIQLEGELWAIVPSENYERTFRSPDALAEYRRLLESAAEVVVLDHACPDEAAFWDAGREVADRADVIFAVWDGLPAAGLGGTGDVVEYARGIDREVVVIWPDGASRGD